MLSQQHNSIEPTLEIFRRAGYLMRISKYFFIYSSSDIHNEFASSHLPMRSSYDNCEMLYTFPWIAKQTICIIALRVCVVCIEVYIGTICVIECVIVSFCLLFLRFFFSSHQMRTTCASLLLLLWLSLDIFSYSIILHR